MRAIFSQAQPRRAALLAAALSSACASSLLCDADGDGLCPPADCDDYDAAVTTCGASSPTPSGAPAAPTGEITLDTTWPDRLSYGAAGESLGSALFNPGDVDGDGVEDLLIGAYSHAAEGGAMPWAGAVYLVHGPLLGRHDLAELTPLRGARWEGARAEGGAGVSVGALRWGPERRPALVVGEPAVLQSEPPFLLPGAVYVAPLDGDGLGGSLADAPLTITSDLPSDWFGYAVAGAGDFDGDGHEDVLVGAPLTPALVGPALPGAAYLFYGPFDLTARRRLDLDDAGLVLRGEVEQGHAGAEVAALGDLDGDGVDDIAVSAFDPVDCDEGNRTFCAGLSIVETNLPGRVYVLFGRRARLEGEHLLAEVGISLPGVQLTGRPAEVDGLSIGDQAGRSVEALPDLNGDGRGELLIGAEKFSLSANEGGGAYVVLSPLATDLRLDRMSRAQGFDLYALTGCGHAGLTVAGVGDVDGDGRADVMISAPHDDPSACGTDPTLEERGAAYLVYQGLEGLPEGPLGSGGGAQGATLRGASPWEAVGYTAAGLGDQDGDGYDDVIVGSLTGRGQEGIPEAQWNGALYVLRGGPRPDAEPAPRAGSPARQRPGGL